MLDFVWTNIIIRPLLNALLLAYGFLGNNYGLAIIVLTIFTRVITFPLTQGQLRSAARMQELQPELDKIKKKYEKDREKQTAKTMELYRENGVNPAGGCLPLLIQFPLLIGFYRAIILSLATSPLQLVALSGRAYSNLPGLSELVPLNSKFLWMDLARPDPLIFVLPVLVVVTSFVAQRLTATPSTNAQQASMTRQMQYTMPVMFGFFALTFPSGLSVYYVTSNLLQVFQGAATGRIDIVNRWLGRESETTGATKTRRDAKKKKASREKK